MADTTVSTLPLKSILHYWLDISQDIGLDFIRLLDYLSERDLGLLDIALSERSIRQLYDFPLLAYYFTHDIIIGKLNQSESHLRWIIKRNLDYHIQKIEISLNKSSAIDFNCYDLRLPNLLCMKFWFIDTNICRIVSLYSRTLRRLDILHGIDEISERSFESICSACNELTHIYISEHTDKIFVCLPTEILPIISIYCKALQVLQLSNMNELYCSSFACLAELTELQVLNIDFMGSDDSSFPSAVFASNTKLRVFSINGFFSHNPIMRGLGEHCHSLKYVTLSACVLEALTDDGIIAMVKGCPLLESIYINALNTTDDFETNVYVTNAAMYAIAQYCTYLEYFRLISIVPLAYDNDGLDAIKYGCPHIRAIHKGMELYYAAPT